jgi:hypothetical protein
MRSAIFLWILCAIAAIDGHIFISLVFGYLSIFSALGAYRNEGTLS